MSDRPKIEDLERQIAELQEQLRAEKQRKESLWNDLYELFLEKIYKGELTEDSEISCKALATLVAMKMTDWANRQRESLGKKIANSGSIRMPVYTDCLNDLVFTLSQPGTTPPKAVDPIELPEVDLDTPAWDEDGTLLPPTPGPRENIPQSQEEGPPPMEKLNSFSKRVNVPKPRPQRA